MANKQFYTLSIFMVGCLLISNVLSKPLMKRETQSTGDYVQTIYEGETVEISCKIFADTSAVVHWLHDGVIYEQGPLDLIASNIISPPPTLVGNLFVESMTLATLTIRNAKRHHSGKYTCVGDTAETRQTKSFMVRVVPRSSHRPSVSGEDVRIYQKSPEVYQSEGDDVHLLCRATQGLTKSAPIIRWTLNGEELNPLDNNYKVYPNGDLRIYRLAYERSDQALQCTAFGEHGTDSYKPFIYVLEPPNQS